MKASLKFREEQKPLMRAKIPISILGLPFLSAISTGDLKELRLDLLTAFESGPSLRASYRPNDPSNPFTLSIKTGIGCFGSPAGAMTAEFNLLSRNPSPSFTVLFRPKFGDFSFKKSVVSSSAGTAVKKFAEVDGEEPAVWIDSPKKEMRPTDLVSGALSGVEVSARSVLPVRSDAAVTFRWGVRLPAEMRTAVLSSSNLPSLVMSKISIEHVAEDKRARMAKNDASRVADVAEACAAVRKQLEEIRVENGALRKALEEMKGSIQVTAQGGKVTGQGRENGVSKGRGVLEGSGGRGREKEEKGVNEELKKALMGATAAGGK